MSTIIHVKYLYKNRNGRGRRLRHLHPCRYLSDQFRCASSDRSRYPTAVPTRPITISDYLQNVPITILVEAVSAAARMGVSHRIHGLTTAVLRGGDLPIAKRLNALTDGADHRAEISDSVLVLSLCRSERTASGEMIDNLTSLADVLRSGSHNSTNSYRDCFHFERGIAPQSCATLNCYTTSIS
jgi:hypothetical protein